LEATKAVLEIALIPRSQAIVDSQKVVTEGVLKEVG
jgi:hypothetical protein